jgi:hypothetical protein
MLAGRGCQAQEAQRAAPQGGALGNPAEAGFRPTRRLPLHPARPPRGATSNKSQDGLFNVGASFTAGYGSAHGPGYVVEVRMVTLSRVPQYLRDRIEEEVVERLREELPKEFPERKLVVERDGQVYKIHGDLRL